MSYQVTANIAKHIEENCEANLILNKEKGSLAVVTEGFFYWKGAVTAIKGLHALALPRRTTSEIKRVSHISGRAFKGRPKLWESSHQRKENKACNISQDPLPA